MKINAVISKPTVKIKYADKSAILTTVIILLGIIIGSIIFILTSDSITNSLFEYFLNFSMDFSNKNKPEIFSGIILSHIPYYIMMLILSTSVIGTPGVITLTFIKSMGLGLITSYIYSEFALKGIEYCLLILFPGKFILIFAMILLTQNCYLSSKTIQESINKEGRIVPLKNFTLRSLFIFLLIIISSVVDFLTLISFSSLSNFN